MTDSNQHAISAESPVLIKQAVWCGAVCALAVVLTALNLYPPIDVQYKVKTRIVVAQQRLEQLKVVLERDRKVISSGKLNYVQLMRLKLLDGVENETVKHDDLMLVELESLWTGRATPAHIEAWLATISKSDPQQLVDSTEAREARFAKWQVECAKHYLQHHQYVGANDATNHSDSTSQLVSTPSSKGGVPAKFAISAANQIAVQNVSASGQLDFENSELVEKKLNDTLNEAEVTIARTAQLFANALEKHAGAIELIDGPQISSKTNTIPTWMSASVLILAFATCAIAGLLQYRAQSGGAYDPTFVGNQLAMDGLPILADIKLPAIGREAASPSVPGGLFRKFQNLTGRYLLSVSEGLLMIWCCAIGCRILLDPLWRSVLFESPLAAFGRLMAGMP